MSFNIKPVIKVEIKTPEEIARFDYYFGITLSGVLAAQEEHESQEKLVERAGKFAIEALRRRQLLILNANAGEFDRGVK